MHAGRGHAAFPAELACMRGIAHRSLRCAPAQLTPPFPYHILCLSPQKESNSKTAKSKTPAPAPPQKNAEMSSESSEEEMPAPQVGRSFSENTAGSELGWQASGGQGQAFPI